MILSVFVNELDKGSEAVNNATYRLDRQEQLRKKEKKT
jgi:hypothetical protein